jgi:mycothiol synthase
VSRAVVNVKPFDLAHADDSEYAALHRFTSRLRSELLPDDPLTPLADAIRAWRATPSFVVTSAWVAWQDDARAIVARGQASYATTDDNRHVAEFAIQVLPECRRQGLARRLLAHVAGVARGAGRRLLVTETSGRVPAGESFMERLGATRGLEAHTYQLAIGRLDRGRVREWMARSAESAPEFELEFWDGPYPEPDLEAAAALVQVMNTQPRGNLDVEDARLTPQRLRQIEDAMWARGVRRWTQIVRERATGALTAFTDVVWTPSAPHVLQQLNTGVRPEYRGRGLARWLKAAMLDRVARERPDVRFVRTSNADANEAMLRINVELGFEPYTSRIVWQADLERVDAYLAVEG